ncbi:tetratricopeptide repeat protein [Plantactinospora sp. GCM10030261]|uniref:tetratricopeptide repeat protein n=1 Tax=Plantactinospora sp. GCM10030261 TaxID=3273420 RepID=UPI00360E7972
MNLNVPSDAEPGAEPVERQVVRAVNGFAYGCVGADIHIFGNGTPVYLLFEHRDPPQPNTTWLRQQPSRMLDPRAEIVPFTGRDAELADLIAWRDTDPPRFAARWLHGEGGQGKTRLAGQLARDSHRAGWQVVDAVHGTDTHPPTAGSQDLRLGNRSVGVLVLVDYADRWPVTELSWLIQNSLLSEPGRRRVRVLLIGRSVSLWPALRDKFRKLGRDVEVSDQFLPPLPGNDPARDRMYTTARDFFARHYPQAPEPSAIAAPQALRTAAFGLTLAVHMAALVAVDAAARGRPSPSDMVGLSAYLLDREYENWRQLYENADRGLDYHTSETDMARAVFTAILTGSTTRPTAERILARLMPQVNAASTLTDQAVCYPPADPAMALEPMVPDRLAEDFLALLVPGHPVTGFPAHAWATGVADTLLTAADTAGHAPRALTFLASATDRWPHLGTNVLYPLLSVHPQVALDGGSVALTAIATIGAHEDDIGPELLAVLKAIESLLPEGSHADLDTGVLDVVERLTTRYLAETTDVERRAMLHMELGDRRSNAGEHTTALTAHMEATRLYRQLPGDEHHRTNLAISLHNLANALSRHGRLSEAIAQAREAVRIHREVVDKEPRRRDALALSLTGLGTQLAESGDTEAALRAVDEAVRIRRELADADPDRHGYDLAVVLTNLAGLLYDLRRVADAVAAADEAVMWGRRMAAASPGRYLDLLGTSLNNLASAQLDQGLRERAAATQAEAVEVYRRLAAANPRAHLPNLVVWLTNLGRVLRTVNRTDESVVWVEEAVLLARQLADGGSVPDQRRLAASLGALGDIVSQLGRADEALVAYREAIDTHVAADRVIQSSGPEQVRLTRRLAALYRQAGDRENEADMLLKFCVWASGSRGHPDIVEAGRRAADLYRDLNNPTGEAAALNNLSINLTATGRHDEAVAACARATEIFRRDGDEGLEVAAALSNLSSALLAAGRYDEAVAAGERSLVIQRELTGEPLSGRPLFNLGSALLGTGRITEAITVLEQATDAYRRIGRGEYEDSARPWLEADAYVELGRAYAAADRSADAARACWRAAELFEAAGDGDRCRKGLLTACDILCRSGRYADAVEVSRRVLAACHSATARPHEAWALAHLGAALLALGDLEDSVTQSRHAASIFAELADRNETHGEAMALANVGQALTQLNRTGEAIDAYQRAVAAWRAVDDTAHEHDALFQLATALLSRRRLAESIEAYQRCAELGRKLGNRSGEARALAGAAAGFVELARFADAITVGRRSADLFREVGDHGHESFALGRVRAALGGLGRIEEAEVVARRTAAAAGQAGDTRGVAKALHDLGELLDQLGRVPDAADAAGQAALVCRETGDHLAEGQALVNLAYCQMKLRQYPAAIEAGRRAAALGRKIEHHATETAALLNLGPALLATGQAEEASTVSQRAVMLIRGLRGPGTDGQKLRALEGQALNTHADALGQLAESRTASGRHEEAIDAYRAAASAFQELGMSANEAATLTNLGLALIRVGRDAEALAPTRRAADLFRAIGDRTLEIRALFHVIQALLGLNRPAESLPVIRKALATCQQIGDHEGEREALLCLGGALVDTRQLDEAIVVNRRAARLFRRAGDHRGEAVVLEFLRKAQRR